MSEFVDLSLDEIIALQKSKAKRGGRNFGGTRGVKRRLNRRFPDRVRYNLFFRCVHSFIKSIIRNQFAWNIFYLPYLYH